MRKISMLTTKSHFIFLIRTSEINDHIYSTEDNPNGNPIGFFISGNSNTFISLDNRITWNPYATRQAPVMHTRSNTCFFGAVAASNDVFHATVIAREDSIVGTWGELNNANLQEVDIIETTEDTFQINEQCGLICKRNLETFEIIPSEQTINIEEDDDVVLN